MKMMFPHKLISIFFLLLCFQGFAQIDSREALERRRQELQQQIERIQGLRTSNLRQEKSVLTQVEDLDQQIRATENLIRVNNQQANLLTRNIAANGRKISELRKELEALKEDYGKMILKSYRSKSQQSRIMFLLSAENFLQAYKRLQYMKQYANYRKEQGEEIKKNTLELQELNKSLAEQKEAKDELIAENRKRRTALERDKKSQQSLISEIRKKENKFAAELRQKQQEIDKIDRAIEKMIAEAIAANNKESGSTDREVFALTPAAKALAADFEKNKGKLPWPVKSGVVSMKFGKQPHPVVRTATMNSNGVRIDTETGGKALSVFSGEVSEILIVKGSHKMVMVRHGDYITIYNNIEDLYVKKGDEVAIGQELGKIATNRRTGKTTLYFVMYKNTEKLNPEQWILRRE